MMVNMYLACTYLYICYIYSTHRFAGHGKENGPLCHAKPGADALKQTLKAITYVICLIFFLM